MAGMPDYLLMRSSTPQCHAVMKFDDYVTEMSERMATTWDCAREHIMKAQKKQKKQHDKHARDPGFQLGDIFVYMPASRQGEA